MKPRALVIDDNPDVARTVSETLASMGHQHDWVSSQEEARSKIAADGYSYVLLDLEIPLAPGGYASMEYGPNLAQEIHHAPAMAGVPVIVMTSHGKEGLESAALLCEHGVVDFINKPFPATGRTLASVILQALERQHRRREHAPHRDEILLEPFVGGELVFGADSITLCDVPVVLCSKSSLMWSILETLCAKLPSGRYRAFDGTALARAVQAEGGQGSIAGCIRDFRRHVSQRLKSEAEIKVGPQDVIESGGSGYRLRPWITVLQGRSVATLAVVTGAAVDTLATQRAYVLAELAKGRHLRAPALAEELRCSESTIKRVLETLKTEGKISFVGPAKTGSYQLIV